MKWCAEKWPSTRQVRRLIKFSALSNWQNCNFYLVSQQWVRVIHSLQRRSRDTGEWNLLLSRYLCFIPTPRSLRDTTQWLSGEQQRERARCKTSYGESGLITYCFIDKLSRAWRKCCVFITGVERHILSLPPLFLSSWNKERKKIEKRVRTVNSHSGEVSVQQRESDVTG